MISLVGKIHLKVNVQFGKTEKKVNDDSLYFLSHLTECLEKRKLQGH